MKFAKYFLIFILLFGFLVLIYFSYQNKLPKIYLNPIDTQSQTDFQKLKFALDQNQINYNSDIDINPSLQKIFLKVYQNNHPIDVILSSNKDLFIQSASLQKLIKMATIKDKQVTHVDLSLKRPYATLQNN
jgi:hypothetical protein